MDVHFDNSALDASHSCGYRESYEALQKLFESEFSELHRQFQVERELIRDEIQS